MILEHCQVEVVQSQACPFKQNAGWSTNNDNQQPLHKVDPHIRIVQAHNVS